MLKRLLARNKTADKVKPSKELKRIQPDGNLNFKTIIRDLTTTSSILSKMVAVFLLLIIIPVSTIGFIATDTASKSLRKSAEESVTAATKQTSNYFDVFLERANNISLQIIANKLVQTLTHAIVDKADQYESLIAHQDAYDALSSINSSSSDMNVSILYNTGYVLGNILQPDGMEKVFASEWYKKVEKAAGKEVWTDHKEGMNSNSARNVAVSMLRIYKDPVTSKTSGLVIVDISYTPVSNILSEISIGMNDSTYLITQEGRVLSAKGAAEEEALAQRQFVKDVQEHSAIKEIGLFHTQDNGEDYLVSYHKSPETGLTAVTIVPNYAITAGATQIVRTTIWAGVIFILLAGTFGFVFSLRMSLAMKSIMGIMSKAEEGDLTASLSMKRKDEIGKLVISFNKMLVKIRELVIQNKQAAEEVVVSSEKMASISAESSRISTEIAHAIIEVASGAANQTSEIDTSVKNVSQLADRISLAVEKTKVMEADSDSMKELSDHGTTTIDSLNRKAAQTNEITLNVVKEIAQLNQYVKNINIITNVLRSIADQTNLLALNAAIEAARAGDAGKGFAVVADEIRKLAEQSNSRTREIQKHIENIFKQAQSSTALVGKAETSIREQSEMVTRTAEVFSRINATATILEGNINKVGSMITDMDSYKEKVLSSMENISAVSEEVSASTQEVSASTEEQLNSVGQLDDMAKQLNELAGNLISQMEKFKV